MPNASVAKGPAGKSGGEHRGSARLDAYFEAAALALVAVIVVAVVLIPLLLFGVELIVLGLLVAAGITGRTLLGRPWVVQALPLTEQAEPLTWRVIGWRGSKRLIGEVVASLGAGLDPSPAEASEPVPAA